MRTELRLGGNNIIIEIYWRYIHSRIYKQIKVLDYIFIIFIQNTLKLFQKLQKKFNIRRRFDKVLSEQNSMVYLTSSRITPSRFVSFVPRVLIEFRAFWLRATVSVSNLGHLSGCGPCWPCGTLLPDVGARNEFNLTALRNWLRSHSSGKFLIVCPAPSREFARFRHGDGHRSPPAG